MKGESSDDDYEQLIDDSRRSFMKKGVLASSVLALGVGSGTTVAGSVLQQEPSEVLVFAYDYRPGTSFQMISRLQQDAVDQILGQSVDDRQIVSQTTDYDGYIVQYQGGGDAPGEYTLVFVQDASLQSGQEYQFATDATFFSADINLLQVSVSTGGDGTPTPEEGTPEDGTPTPEDETPTPEDGTPTPENGTPTPEDGTPTPADGTPTPGGGAGDGGPDGNGGGNGGPDGG